MDTLLDAEALQARLTTRYVGRWAELHEEIDSTNRRAVQLARTDAPHGALVLADHQSLGRGRLGRRWHAPPGSSLLLSLILRPDLTAAQAQRLTMICALAAVEAVAAVTGLRVAIKWPNDVYLQERKLGGILTELGLAVGGGPRLAYAVVGLGLNVNLDVAALPEVAVPATSLLAALGRPVSRREVLVALLAGVERRFDALAEGVSPAKEWRAHLLTLGRNVQVTTPTGAVEGRAEDVDADGALLVRLRDGTLERVVAGDVTLRGPQPQAGPPGAGQT